jgi:UDP-N-acetylmuramoyl-L-alanyl-D-glutamate--2,6-diaminopimelate ligase
MLIDEALRGVEVQGRSRSAVDVMGIQYDSRKVQQGDIFVAMRGGATDGNRYLTAAIDRGARAIITDSREVWDRERLNHLQIPFYLVGSGRRALAGVAANLFGHPEKKLALSAVTGTNGKTTTALLLEQMLRSVERKCVLIGTIETHVGDEVRVSPHTTPEASDTLRVFADGVAVGATEAVTEMSSHALEQERVWGLPVDVGIFTNLTQDHLDYHGTMERYFEAKARLFEGVGTASPRIAVVNADDPYGDRIEEIALASGCEVWKYGWQAKDGWGPEFRTENVKLLAGETTFVCKTSWGNVAMRSPLTGRVNVYNLLAASCAALARGLTLEEIAAAAEKLGQVAGRFEVVPGSNEAGFTVVVDYAHTDDALRNLIALARELVGESGGRVITLFGCGGDRDRMKRPKMGRVAGDGSDLVVLTSDNPRSEDASAIIAEALVGVRETQTDYIVEQDRAGAIEIAIRAARVGDIVLLAGKGHEKVQILKDRTVPFDDVAVATGVLKEIA